MAFRFRWGVSSGIPYFMQNNKWLKDVAEFRDVWWW